MGLVRLRVCVNVGSCCGEGGLNSFLSLGYFGILFLCFGLILFGFC